ncbi:NAD(P)H-binding protein, partial [Hymenobacter terrigena]
SQIYLTRPAEHPEMAERIEARARGEAALRTSGAQYTIVRPSWLHDLPADGVRVEQGDTGDGRISRAAVADGLVDRSYVDSRTRGFEAVWRIVARWWPERVERVTGVAAEDQRRVAALLAGARNAYVLTARGTEQHATGADTVTAWINLALALGLPPVPSPPPTRLAERLAPARDRAVALILAATLALFTGIYLVT